MQPGQDRTAVTHALKTWPAEFQAIIEGRKRFEWRRDDRGYEVGDMLRLLEWDPLYDAFTGSWAMVQVTYVLRAPGFEMPQGWCVLSIGPMLVNWRDDQRLMSASED